MNKQDNTAKKQPDTDTNVGIKSNQDVLQAAYAEANRLEGIQQRLRDDATFRREYVGTHEALLRKSSPRRKRGHDAKR